MPIAKVIRYIFSSTQPALCAGADTAPAAIDGKPLTPPLRRDWLLGAGLIAGALVFAAAGDHDMAVPPHQEAAWLQRLANSGDADAQLQLGLAYRDGRYGLASDAGTGLYWLTQAAVNGQSYAADRVGTAYEKGQGAPPDMARARYWWTLAANGGNAHAEQRLGEILAASDPAMAENWLKRAAARGNPQAARDLHQLYSRNRAPASDLRLDKDRLGVFAQQLDSPILKTLASARAFLAQSAAIGQSPDTLRRDAHGGDPTAEFQLGMRYRDGGWGVNRNPAQAEYWLRRAAAGGNRLAAQALAGSQPG